MVAYLFLYLRLRAVKVYVISILSIILKIGNFERGYYMQRNKRVILIQGEPGKFYEQAIFILRENSQPNTDLIQEAERIINGNSKLQKLSAYHSAEFMQEPRPAPSQQLAGASNLATLTKTKDSPAKTVLNQKNKRGNLFFNSALNLALIGIAALIIWLVFQHYII